MASSHRRGPITDLQTPVFLEGRWDTLQGVVGVPLEREFIPHAFLGFWLSTETSHCDAPWLPGRGSLCSKCYCGMTEVLAQKTLGPDLVSSFSVGTK